MERIQNIKDTHQRMKDIAKVLGVNQMGQRIEDIAKVLDIGKGYITYNEEEQVYLISTLQELEKLEIKKEVDFSQLRNFPLKFTKCHFSQDLLVNEQEFKEKLIFDNVVFSKIINFSRNTFYGEVGFFGCEFENKLYLTQCLFHDNVMAFGVNLLSIDCRDSIFTKEVYFGREINDPNLEKGFHFGSCSFKDGVFLNCQFRDNVYFKNNEFDCAAAFQNARFYSNAYFDDSVFKDFADFNKCEFREIANFYGVKFKKVPNFSQAQFKGSLNVVNTNLDFGFESLKEKIEQEHKQQNPNSKKSLAHFANDFRDSFRVFKNALIKDNNLLDASNFHKYELYCKEIELDSKETKTLKDKIEKWQLRLYYKLCDHHTDILKSFHSLMLVIGLFGLMGLIVIVGFDYYYLGYKPFSHLYMAKEIYDAHIHSFIKTHTPYIFAFNFFILAFYLCMLFISILFISVEWIPRGFFICIWKILKRFFIGIWKILRGFFIVVSYVSYVIVICILLVSPKILIPAMGIFTDKRALLDPLSTLGGIYTICFGFVLFSFIKTIRKNSIVPN